MNRTGIVAKIEEIAERVAQPKEIEIVEIDLKGTGRHQVLRIVIDKLAGVAHGDCEFISHEVGAVLDVEDTIHGEYTLEVSSPGLERKLLKWKDWERFVGKKIKVVLRDPLGGFPTPSPVAPDGVQPISKSKRAAAASDRDLKHFEGTITRAQDQVIAVELPDGAEVSFPFGQVDRAHLKFEW